MAEQDSPHDRQEDIYARDIDSEKSAHFIYYTSIWRNAMNMWKNNSRTFPDCESPQSKNLSDQKYVFR